MRHGQLPRPNGPPTIAWDTINTSEEVPAGKEAQLEHRLHKKQSCVARKFPRARISIDRAVSKRSPERGVGLHGGGLVRVSRQDPG